MRCHLPSGAVRTSGLALELGVDAPPRTDRENLDPGGRYAVDDPKLSDAQAPRPGQLAFERLTEIGIAL